MVLVVDTASPWFMWRKSRGLVVVTLEEGEACGSSEGARGAGTSGVVA